MRGASVVGALVLGGTAAVEAGRLHGFGPATFVGLEADLGATVDRVAGDFDGDGLTDLARIRKRDLLGFPVGTVTVQRNTDGAFGGAGTWTGSFVTGSELVMTGDVNGDGRDDLVAFTRGSTADVFVALSTGSGFGAKTKWHDTFCFNSELPLVGDVDGDGRDDIVTLTRGTSADVFVATSNGSSFVGNGWLWNGDFCPGEALPAIGDVNGDGRDDLLAFYRDSQTGTARGDVYVATANFGSGFAAARKWHDWFCVGSEVPLVGDVDADGRADVLTFTRGASKDLYVALSEGTAFAGTGDRWHDELCDSGQVPLAGRFNRDGNADVVCVASGGVGQSDLVLAGGHAQPRAATEDDFGYGTMGVAYDWLPPLASRPAQVQVALLAVMVEVPGAQTFASRGRPASFWEQWVFGPGDPSLVNYFSEMSGGKLRYTRAGLIGPLQLDPSAAPGGDVRNFLKQKVRETGFDFRPYDRDGDGEITNRELVIVQIDNGSNSGGQTIHPTEVLNYSGTALTVRSSVAAAGFLGRLDLFAHELAHTLGTTDFYSSGCYAQGLSLMHCNASAGGVVAVHLDSYHKMRLGWVRPNVYDARYPGGAFVALGQNSASTPSQPPVILHDPRRGTNEYYLAEYRSNTWNSGRRLLPAGAAAGYDTNAVGTGVALWYLNTNANDHYPVNRLSAIRPGANLTLESSPWPGTDDVVYNGAGLWFTSDRFYTTFVDPGPNGILDSHPPFEVQPGPNGLIDTPVASGSDDIFFENRIFPGPDKILQSFPPRGSDDMLNIDDGYGSDAMVFTSVTPANYVSRRSTTLYQKASGLISPQWFDNSAIGAEVRVDNYSTGSAVSFVQWGLPFVPWLTRAQTGSLVAGAPFFLDGTMGVRNTSGDSPVPVFRSAAGSEHDLEVLSWTGSRATVRMPLTVPAGRGSIVCYSDGTRTVESNSLPVQIENAFFLWVNQELGQLIGPNTPAGALGPWFDFDRDGIPNFGEFLIGTSAGVPDRKLPIELKINPGQGLDIQWSHLTTRSEYGEAVAQFSEDLEKWEDLPWDSEWKIGETVYRSAFRPLAKQGFVRRVFRTPGVVSQQ